MKIRKIGLEIDLAQFCDPSADAGGEYSRGAGAARPQECGTDQNGT